jgi:hypothetical protein
MADAEDLRTRRLASSEARNAAVRKLKEAHPAEYRILYEEEAVKRGIRPAGVTRAQRIARLRAELDEMERLEA